MSEIYKQWRKFIHKGESVACSTPWNNRQNRLGYVWYQEKVRS